MNNRIVFGCGFDPWRNLAVEKCLFESCAGENILYLWQNDNTVVIGRNQNAWKECRLSAMKRDGIRLARRESGGGAVFHDLGNLNFTFISPIGGHDVRRQLQVIQDAIRNIGIETDLSGRNDLVARENGCKFSGNAFQRGRANALHHGTILVGADTGKMQRYLTPSSQKLRAKGVDSVRSRVCNLAELSASATVARVRGEIVAAHERAYGPHEASGAEAVGGPDLERRYAEFSSREWRLGRSPECNVELSRRFEWGEVELGLSVRGGVIAEARVCSDALDEQFILGIAPLLPGCELDSAALCRRLSRLGPSEPARDLAAWIADERL